MASNRKKQLRHPPRTKTWRRKVRRVERQAGGNPALLLNGMLKAFYLRSITKRINS